MSGDAAVMPERSGRRRPGNGVMLVASVLTVVLAAVAYVWPRRPAPMDSRNVVVVDQLGVPQPVALVGADADGKRIGTVFCDARGVVTVPAEWLNTRVSIRDPNDDWREITSVTLLPNNEGPIRITIHNE